MIYPKPTVKIIQLSWSLPCAEFSTKDNPNQFMHHITLFLLRCFLGVHRNHLLTQAGRWIMPTQFHCWWKQPVLPQGSLQQPPWEMALPSPLSSSVPATTVLPQPKTHRWPARRTAGYWALSLAAATITFCHHCEDATRQLPEQMTGSWEIWLIICSQQMLIIG